MTVLSCLAVGVALGAAEPVLRSVVLKDTTIADVLTKTSTDWGFSVIVRNPPVERKSVTVSATSPKEAVTSSLAPFGLDAVSVSGVYVARPVLRPGANGRETLAVARQWMDATGGSKRWKGFIPDWRERGQRMGEELGPGTYDYKSLTPAQKAIIEDFARRWESGLPISQAGYLVYGHGVE